MIYFKLLHRHIDIDSLKEDLVNNDELWKEITLRQDHPESDHKDTECIFVRWCKSLDVTSVFNDLVAVDYPAYDKLPSVINIIDEVIKVVPGELGRVIITKLKPDGLITKHFDMGAYADYYQRFHIPIFSNFETDFRIYADDERRGEFCNMDEGELWQIDHKKQHYCYNGGDTARVHLIIDIKKENNEIL